MAQPVKAPKTLPADFNQWDTPAADGSAPPSTLPADFSGWDGAKKPPAESTGILGSLKRTGSAILNFPGQIYHAATDDPKDKDEEFTQGTAGPVGLAMRRLIGDPMAAERKLGDDLRTQAKTQGGDEADNAYNGTNHLANMHTMAGYVPVLGPLAGGIVNRFTGGGGVKQDKAGAVTDLGTAVAAPEVGKQILRGAGALADTAPVVKLRMNVANALDAAAPKIKNIVTHPIQHAAAPAAEAITRGIANRIRPIGVAGDIPGGVPPTGPNLPPPSAPYRVSGSGLTEPVTVTPRQILPPSHRLGVGEAPEPEILPPLTPAPLKASNPAAAQTEILKRMGVAAPRATLNPMESVPSAAQKPAPWLNFKGIRSGESAAAEQLTHTSQNALRSMAMERGIKVTPQMTSQQLQTAIHGSLTPAEIADFEQTALERQQPDYSPRSTNGEKPLGMRVGNNTAAGAAIDTADFAAARQKLGPDASTSEVAQEAIRMQKMTKGSDLIEGLKQMKAGRLIP